jgi:UDP-4-amino-4,6-dideoxy-N-acetyl-beta-L-altrosamine transaminase
LIHYGQQHIDDTDKKAILDVLDSDFLTQGPKSLEFESKLAHTFNAKHAVAVNSATSALHIACLSLGLGQDDCAWTVPNTFVASANSVLMCGANVNFVDIDLNTYNISIDLLEEKLKEADRQGNLPKIIIPVHFAGEPCDMEKINNLKLKYGFSIIEDASHAVGAKYKCGSVVGSNKYSDITVLSFHPVKIITTGEGGACLTNNPVLAKNLKKLSSHGITRDPEDFHDKSKGLWYYEQNQLGYNYRITDIQSALGISQLNKIDRFLKKRKILAAEYDRLLADEDVANPIYSKGSALHLYVIKLKNNQFREKIFTEMRKSKIGVNVHYFPVHLQPYFKSLGFKAGMFPQAETYSNVCLTLPLHPKLEFKDLNFVVENLLRHLK